MRMADLAVSATLALGLAACAAQPTALDPDSGSDATPDAPPVELATCELEMTPTCGDCEAFVSCMTILWNQCVPMGCGNNACFTRFEQYQRLLQERCSSCNISRTWDCP